MDEQSEYSLGTATIIIFGSTMAVAGALLGAGATIVNLLPDKPVGYPLLSAGGFFLALTVAVLICRKDRLRIRQLENASF